MSVSLATRAYRALRVERGCAVAALSTKSPPSLPVTLPPSPRGWRTFLRKADAHRIAGADARRVDEHDARSNSASRSPAFGPVDVHAIHLRSWLYCLRISGSHTLCAVNNWGAENSDVLPSLPVAVAVKCGPVTPAGLLNVHLPAGLAVVCPSYTAP